MINRDRISVQTSEGEKSFATPIFLDLGCGLNKFRKDYVGIDISKDVGADIVLDIGSESLPFPDESVDFIYTAHTFEHLDNEQFIWVMNECFRVLRWTKDSGCIDGGQIQILVPHRDCELAWQDPKHQKFFVKESFKFFCGDYLIKHKLDYGISAIFKEVYKKLVADHDPAYCTMIDVSLAKNYEHYKKCSLSFPFNKGIKLDIKSNGKEYDFESFIESFFKPADPRKHNLEFSSEVKEVIRRMITHHADQLLKIKVDATKRYGANPAPGGMDGLYHDLLRKFARIHGYFKKGERLTSENIIDTLYDNAVYSILAVMELKAKEEEFDR